MSDWNTITQNIHKKLTWTKKAAGLKKFPYERGVPRKIFGTVRQNFISPFPTKTSILWKTLYFKMVSFCKVDLRYASNFVQCIPQRTGYHRHTFRPPILLKIPFKRMKAFILEKNSLFAIKFVFVPNYSNFWSFENDFVPKTNIFRTYLRCLTISVSFFDKFGRNWC